MPRAAVLGSPIAHSLSPVLHRAAYAAMGLSGWTYEAIECDEAGLAPLLDGLGAEWVGLSLTMPLKRTVLKLVDEVSETAAAVGGANTVIWRDGRRFGDNTDVYGIVTALTEAGVRAPRSAVVLGGGATAASALAALRELGLEAVTLAVRDPARAEEARGVGERLGLSVGVLTFDALAGALPVDLVVSTLPGRAADPYCDLVAESGAALFDVVYAPWSTALAQAVERAGGTVVGGFPMLLHQAVRQVAMMTGREDVPVEAMRTAGEAELASRARRGDPH
ncbi:shikimate dehydrogenase [Thermomonospora echinospora]|uniref:Shikimate dehydrogenase n=1 Tax=Thermomonospora echinospora TaxID=1992 RepID=A0A1H6DXC9_9ACTN|nr:shikimate dehydrogenase [Thermomonospora echinospora]SEG89363.1 shikimate dehydrogenase [Thermomonospora echinospora]